VTDIEGQPNRRKQNEGRLDHPSRAADRINLGSSFGLRFAVFIDAEEEFDWTQPRSRTSTNTSAIKYLPEFQRLMDAHGVQPCYMIDYPVADNVESAAIIAEMVAGGRCDVGTQLHPWVSPPFHEEVNTFNSFAGNLPISLERAKLSVLTEKIAATAGKRPVVYRAGRYGIGANTAQLLDELGYRMDVSVRPHFDYSDEGGPNFRRHDVRPYWAGPGGNLLEVPLGVAFTGALRRYGRFMWGGGKSSLRRRALLSRFGLASRIALTPEDMPFDDVRRAIRGMLSDGVQLLSISFHSPSLTPGHTPYVRNSAQLSEFYVWWDKILALLDEENAKPASVAQILDAAWASR
jgi:hypothetical protein